MLRFLLLLTAALLLVPTSAAEAETVRLRSGRTLEVDAVRVLEDRIQITLFRDGGTARVDLRFERLDARGLLALFDRHTDPQDADVRLRTARLALERGLRGEAARRFEEAARLDPQLASECDAGLATLRAQEAAEGVLALEMRLRAGGDPHAAMAQAAALLDGPSAKVLSARQQARVRALGALARRLFKRAQQRAARKLLEAKKPAVPAVDAPAAPPAKPDSADPALALLRTKLRALETKADIAREAAADPQLAPTRVLRHLESAAKALNDARRLLRAASADQRAALQERGESLRRLLVSIYTELADLYRRQGRIAEARARVRAVLILDPGNEQAAEQRRLIEDDLRRDPVYDDGYGRGFEAFLWSPSPFYARGYRYPYFGGGSYGYRRYGHHGGFVLRLGGHGHRHGTRRVVGTRR